MSKYAKGYTDFLARSVNKTSCDIAEWTLRLKKLEEEKNRLNWLIEFHTESMEQMKAQRKEVIENKLEDGM